MTSGSLPASAIRSEIRRHPSQRRLCRAGLSGRQVGHLRLQDQVSGPVGAGRGGRPQGRAPEAPDLYEPLGRLHRPAGGLLQDPCRPRHRPVRRHHPESRQAAHPALRLCGRPQRPQKHHRPPRRENFPRIRIGVGAKPRPDYDLADWVLGKFPPDDAKALADRCPDIAAAAKLIMDGKLGLAQSKYNG